MDQKVLCPTCGYLVHPEHFPCPKAKRDMKKTLYLQSAGWAPGKEEDRDGWFDPQNGVHYYQKDALNIQRLRDRHKTERFKREPLAYN